MTTVVVDATVIVQGCLEATGFELLAGVDMVGPRLLRSEALSALHELLWRREISPVLAERALDRLQRAPYEVHDPEGLTEAAWQVAEALGWAKTYDAEYVALARILGHPLVTIDSRLARGAGQVVQIVGPGDLSTLG